MKTSNYLIALAALTSFTFVSCSDNDFLGTGSGPNGAQQGNGEITFATGTQKITRSETLQGKDAAERLGNQFIVYGWKSDAFTKGTSETAGTYTAEETVFPYYLLTFQEGSAYSTESNTHSWEYVGNVSVPTDDHVVQEGVNQTIKYWDYAKAQYDFIAWDIKPGSTATYALKGGAKSPWKPNWLEFKAETADEASNIYFADKVTVTNNNAASVDVANKYGGYVQFKFRNLTAKVRMALYETVPGYSVTDVKFYDAATMASPTAKTYLYSAASDIPTSGATINVKFSDGTGDAASKIPENQAVADFASITKGTNISFGTLTPDKPREYKEWYASVDEADNVKNKWLGRVSNDPSFATGMYDGKDIGTSDEDLLRNHYTYVFPKAATELCLKVDYRLKSLDGSTDDIIVKGANAIIPATFCEWKANFAYTYLFKISDNTNGTTGTSSSDPAGLYPITFDACVVDMVEGNAQETITELANASVTTYQFGTVVTDYDEYVQKEAPNATEGTPAYIYVTASNKSGTNPATGLAKLAATAADANTYKAELFLVNNFGDEKITEESVANYKNNNIILTDITTSCFHYADAIPAGQTMDNVQKNFSDDGNNVAYFAPKAGYTYAVRFTDNAGKMVYKVIKVDGNLAADRSYTLATKSGTSAVAENAILADAVTLTENYTDADAGGTAKDYNVLGAGRLLAATNFTFVDGTTYGKYDAVANVAATTASGLVVTFTPDTDVKDGTNTLATSAIEFANVENAILDIWPDAPAATNQVQLKVGSENSTATATFTITGLNGATGVTLGTIASGLVPLTVADDARGGKEFSLAYSNANANQSVEQVLAVKTLHVGQWSLGVDKKYVNYSTKPGFTTTSALTLSLQKSTGSATATYATTASKIKALNGTVSKASVVQTEGTGAGVGKYTVTPTAASNFKLSYTNAASIDITTTNIDWVLKNGSGVEQAIGTTVANGTYYLHVNENGSPAYVSTLSIEGGTITRTGDTGVYKVVVSGGAGATISLNYKGIPNYIQTAYVTP